MSRQRRGLLAVVALAMLAAVFAAGWWAARTALDPPRDPLGSSTPTFVTAEQGQVEQALDLSATGQWRQVQQVGAPVEGTVTATATPDGAFAAGDVVLSINLAPVVVAEGRVPAFRGLQEGLAGADVEQLQLLLSEQGYLEEDPTGSFGPDTATAVRAWQKEQGMPGTGEVPLGTIVFVKNLPSAARILVDVGDRIAPGEPIIEVLADSPNFRAVVTDEQLALVEEGTPVELTRGDASLSAAAGPTEEDDGARYLSLVGSGDEPVCPDPCDEVSTQTDSRWSARAMIVPPEQGVVVPVAALQTRPDGQLFVVTAAGDEVDVEAGASASGRVVIDGLEAGTRVRLPSG